MPGRFSLMLHGGAGDFVDVIDEPSGTRYLAAIRVVLEHGRSMLSRGAGAVATVEACVSRLEDDPLFNAGRGAVLNADGRVELDAGIMDGRDLAAGAVAAVCNVANPVQLARRVMEDSGHVLLVGDGARRFAEQCGLPLVPDQALITPERLAQWQAKARREPAIDGDSEQLGTVGAVARDGAGNLAAATSTGGVVHKRAGRVGDSPLIGAGVYADNETCAVSTTGHGEDFIRTVFAKSVADLVALRGMAADAAVAAGLAELTRRVQGRGGVICIDATGRCASGMTTARMLHGWIEHGGASVVRF